MCSTAALRDLADVIQLRSLLEGFSIRDSVSEMKRASVLRHAPHARAPAMRRLILAFLLCLSPLPGFAMPRPVQLGIANLPQETEVWCWAAVAQQIIAHHRGMAYAPPQGALVAVANAAHPEVCCGMANPACVRTGSLPQIAGLIQAFGGRNSRYVLPADPSTLHQTLSMGPPVIMHVATGLMTSHVVVVTGMHH